MLSTIVYPGCVSVFDRDILCIHRFRFSLQHKNSAQIVNAKNNRELEVCQKWDVRSTNFSRTVLLMLNTDTLSQGPATQFRKRADNNCGKQE